MKIYQGHQSKSLGAFQFMDMYKVVSYTNSREPLVVFGCYNDEDLEVVKNHNGIVFMQWWGLDSKMQKDYSVFTRKNVFNVTTLPNIVTFLNEKGVKCELLKYVVDDWAEPQIAGNKIYTYIHKKNPVYYGSEVLKQINTPYEVVIGDYTLPVEKWRGKPRDDAYSQAFVGMQLCNYAGGGYGIIELGLRGIPVITNVLDLPHCFHWKTVQDIEKLIKVLSHRIGKKDEATAKRVMASILFSEELECYDFEQLKR